MDIKGIFLAIFILALVDVSSSIPASNAMSRFRRSEQVNTEETKDNQPCSEQIACQWGVYGNDARKRISFFIDNKNCLCGPGRKCAKAEDNLSMAAYIYRCTDDTTTTTEGTPAI